MSLPKAALLVIGLFAVSSMAYGNNWVRFKDGLLSVEFSELDLPSALEMTAQETGIRFSIDPKVETGKLSERFDEVALETAIRRILKGYNYVVVADPRKPGAGKISKVMLLAKVTEAERKSRPAQGPAASAGEVVLRRQEGGHYIATGKINNRPVEFLIDTGATFVAIPGELAKEMSLAIGPEKPVDTVKGRSVGFDTVLERVELGGLTMNQVQAVVLPDMETGRRVLLGMNFLSAFHLVQQDDSLTLRKR